MLINQYKNKIYIVDKLININVERGISRAVINVRISDTRAERVATYETYDRAKEVFSEFVQSLKSNNPVFEMPEV
jgi:hypothetical protein